MCICGKNPNRLYCGEGACVMCIECRSTSPLTHKETCSKWKHIPDDHYDSACMRGTCKYCNPDYKPNFAIKFTLEEREKAAEALEYFLDNGSWEGVTDNEEYLIKSALRKIKGIV